ncbi:MAG: twitching motility protein PilT [Burkholderiales bacterium PBB3]|nr:MAG: twitching motility protein PilT [Burkholderiales bacterium PBB3]
MAGLDTNVLVRYLIQDDVRQGFLAKRLVDAALARGETLFVPITVLLELEWVLRSNFEFPKSQIIHTISSLLAAKEIEIESETSAEVALELFRQNKADFADCIHIALAHAAGHDPLWTFDKAASNVNGASLIKDRQDVPE